MTINTKAPRPLPSHFFISETSGHLHDTRKDDWARHPIRENYGKPSRGFPLTAEGGRALRATLRQRYVWPGGYEMILVADDGEALCVPCVKENFRAVVAARRYNDANGWLVKGMYLDCETDELVYCSHCGSPLCEIPEIEVEEVGPHAA